MPLLSRFAAFVFLGALSLFPASLQALTVLGTGTGALLGGDLTDPEDDGNDGNGSGFNWLSTAASSENNFGGEGALDVFDNQVGSGDTKWCCNAPPQWVAVQLDKPYVLTHFTLAAGNDFPSRDPNIWSIEGSNDGITWTPIYQWTSGVSPFSNRLEVIRFDGNGQDFASPAPFSWFRYRVTSTDSDHQINELELFGVPVVVFNDFSIDKPLIPTGEPITLSWDLDPGVTNVSIDNGVGDVTAQTVNGIGQITLNPGPGSNTTYTMTAIHPESTAQQSVHVTVTNQPIINSFAATPAVIDPGGSTTLRWDVFNISSLDLNGSDVTGQTSLAVSPATTTVYTLTASNPNGSDVANLNVTVVVPGEPIISEFMASNGGASIVDEDGDSSDWIEIHNPSGNIAMLDGYYLTDDPGDLQKWAFPAVNLAPRDYLIVFASGKDRVNPASELHTNFSLDSSGEYLALVKPDGVTIVSEFGPAGTDYPEQEADLSFGNFGNPPQPGYFDTATPGEANSVGFLGFVADTKFDLNRGFYNSPQSVTISTATPGASIRYTTDGSWPSETSGTLYSGPVLINRTTPLRAIAYKASHRPTNVDTHTYIFVDDVITQRSSTTQSIWGFPSSWDGNSVDYGMNSNVVSLHNRTIRNDLKTVPTLSIAMDSDDLFGSRGIYSHPQNSGVSWERGTSLELIDPANPDGSNDFQHNCGIRIQGGAFRSFGLTRKKSFRVLFKDIYGTSKLRYPFFGPTAAQQFDTLIFRMESNDGYQWGNRTNVQYARDEFGRRSQLAMGSPSAHGRFMHIYLNGVYWGLYNVVERPDDSMGENYFGARKEDWDGVNSGNATNEGSTSSWNRLKSLASGIPNTGSESSRTAIYMEAQGLNSDGTDNPTKADYIDIDNYIDYLIVNWYMGNNDWPYKNYYHGRERDLLDNAPFTGTRSSSGTHFFCWDAEWSLFLNSSSDKTGSTSGVAEPYGNLRSSREFRVRFGDRAHRSLFNDGAMTPQKCLDRYAEICQDHQSILIPELARWGDQHGTQRTIQHWINEYNHIRDDWLATRTPEFVSVLQGANLYPQLAAVTYSQHGGNAPDPLPPTIFRPGDPILGGQIIGNNFEVGGVGGGGNNWPGGEGPEHAIDGVGQKYLNFAKFNAGVLVTPSGGPSVAASMTLWAANDAVLRDPSSYELYGTTADVTGPGPFALDQFTLISSGDLALPDSRNPGGNADLDDINSQDMLFSNSTAYTSYLIVFPTVKNSASANSMQIAEIQLTGQFGGVTMFTDADTIYYTLDGTDPRLIGGGIRPGTLNATFGGGGPTSQTFMTTGHSWKYWDQGTDPGAGWKLVGFNDNAWPSGPSQLGYGSNDEGSGTTVSFGPNSGAKYAATYFRTTVNIPDPSVYDHFLLRVKYDDACGLYVNGTPVVLTSNLPNGANSAFNQYANGTVSNEDAWKDFTVPTSDFVAGTNTLAVQIHQASGGSSDIRLDVTLRGEVTPVGGGSNESDPIFFSDHTVLTARSYDSGSGEWSALNQALFTVDVIPADSSSLVISEINYHPYQPVTPGEVTISTDRDDYEFIEFLNVSGSTLDLTGVRFDAGITFTFPDNTFLPSGQRLLIVRNLAAFLERYPGVDSANIGGVYSGRLSNDGEHILLTGPGGTIHDFTYNDQLPWPTAADGSGPSLVLVNPSGNPDHGQAASWTASRNPGGSPGTTESSGVDYASWAATSNVQGGPNDDDDHDTISNFMEFLQGSRPDAAGDAQGLQVSAQRLEVNGEEGDYLVITYQKNLNALGTLTIELSSDLITWNSGSNLTELLTQVDNGNGTATVTVRLKNPVRTPGRSFARLRGE